MTSPFDEAREVLREAEGILASHARRKTFRATYSRANPGAHLRSNVFFFGDSEGPPRAVIFGRWLYVHAPDYNLPRGFKSISDEVRREKHLGQLHARVSLQRSTLPLIAELAQILRRSER
jgi:hypothetical protein